MELHLRSSIFLHCMLLKNKENISFSFHYNFHHKRPTRVRLFLKSVSIRQEVRVLMSKQKARSFFIVHIGKLATSHISSDGISCYVETWLSFPEPLQCGNTAHLLLDIFPKGWKGNINFCFLFPSLCLLHFPTPPILTSIYRSKPKRSQLPTPRAINCSCIPYAE